jgi:hypothetical protein
MASEPPIERMKLTSARGAAGCACGRHPRAARLRARFGARSLSAVFVRMPLDSWEKLHPPVRP